MKVHKDIKLTTYNVNSFNKRSYDPVQKSLFSQLYLYGEEEFSSEKLSSSLTSNNLNYSLTLNQNNNLNNNNNNSFLIIEGKYTFENFIKKYKSTLELIIVYGYFIRKIENIIKTKFILPLNLGDGISEVLKMQKIELNNSHFLSFLNNNNILHITIDFNSLDNQTFEKLILFLNKNQLINVCNLSFFPPEEYFKTELLFRILQKNDDNYKPKKNENNKYKLNKKIILDLRSDEEK